MQKLLICALFFISIKVFGQNNEAKVNLAEAINLKLKRETFNPKGKKIEYLNSKIVIAVNNKPILGTDGELPKYQLTEAILTISGVDYKLDVSDMYNPWFATRLNEEFFKIRKLGTGQYKLFALFSDGAGFYGAEWLIIGKSSIRTILSNDEVILYEYFEDKMK